MSIQGIYLIYGLCIMFYFMMTWFFLRKSDELLSRLVAALMLLLGVQCVKDLFFLTPDTESSGHMWMVMTSLDMIAVPMYVFILIELCKSGTLRRRTMVIHEAPFVILPLLFIITREAVFYYVEVVWAAIYGGSYAVWTVVMIPRYHRRLRQRFSYEDNIDLNWLRTILVSFFVILTLWLLVCMLLDFDIEVVYMLGTLGIWMFICYFIYRHESVIDELCEATPAHDDAETPDGVTDGTVTDDDAMREQIKRLFDQERVYLNPQLKLSTVAALINSNRTYVSRFFNNSHGKTFFEFVNEYRVRHAMELLRTTGERIEVIAERSGFNSRQSFHRVFIKLTGTTPETFRAAPAE